MQYYRGRGSRRWRARRGGGAFCLLLLLLLRRRVRTSRTRREESRNRNSVLASRRATVCWPSISAGAEGSTRVCGAGAARSRRVGQLGRRRGGPSARVCMVGLRPLLFRCLFGYLCWTSLAARAGGWRTRVWVKECRLRRVCLRLGWVALRRVVLGRGGPLCRGRLGRRRRKVVVVDRRVGRGRQRRRRGLAPLFVPGLRRWAIGGSLFGRLLGRRCILV